MSGNDKDGSARSGTGNFGLFPRGKKPGSVDSAWNRPWRKTATEPERPAPSFRALNKPLAELLSRTMNETSLSSGKGGRKDPDDIDGVEGSDMEKSDEGSKASEEKEESDSDGTDDGKGEEKVAVTSQLAPKDVVDLEEKKATEAKPTPRPSESELLALFRKNKEFIKALGRHFSAAVELWCRMILLKYHRAEFKDKGSNTSVVDFMDLLNELNEEMMDLREDLDLPYVSALTIGLHAVLFVRTFWCKKTDEEPRRAGQYGYTRCTLGLLEFVIKEFLNKRAGMSSRPPLLHSDNATLLEHLREVAESFAPANLETGFARPSIMDQPTNALMLHQSTQTGEEPSFIQNCLPAQFCEIDATGLKTILIGDTYLGGYFGHFLQKVKSYLQGHSMGNLVAQAERKKGRWNIYGLNWLLARERYQFSLATFPGTEEEHTVAQENHYWAQNEFLNQPPIYAPNSRNSLPVLLWYEEEIDKRFTDEQLVEGLSPHPDLYPVHCALFAVMRAAEFDPVHWFGARRGKKQRTGVYGHPHISYDTAFEDVPQCIREIGKCLPIIAPSLNSIADKFHIWGGLEYEEEAEDGMAEY
ncbi:hypothetical protein BJ508DRAFT_332273 [Ascobolus immersus RN42]|uniref:Uncharacterized protein n=1 Tax=Ascobolus immersus RN42 TaxID=1160509 RepID=A0A3N4HQP6_ASCIM|nr:hypothetical protein BJ508DRAFT_332273 [Ascobolus immersus RN42]